MGLCIRDGDINWIESVCHTVKFCADLPGTPSFMSIARIMVAPVLVVVWQNFAGYSNGRYKDVNVSPPITTKWNVTSHLLTGLYNAHETLSRITFAGFPTTTLRGGTSRVTIAPAAMIAPSPT